MGLTPARLDSPRAARPVDLPAQLIDVIASALDPGLPTLARLEHTSAAALYLASLQHGLVTSLDGDGTPWPLIADALGVSVAEARVTHLPPVDLPAPKPVEFLGSLETRARLKNDALWH